MNWGPVDYKRTEVPSGYACTHCGATGVKLWRLYATFPASMKLFCVDCALANQQMADQVDAEGLSPSRGGKKTDKIGNLVPAVPGESGDSFWGYMTVPAEGVRWWKGMPLRAAGARA